MERNKFILQVLNLLEGVDESTIVLPSKGVKGNQEGIRVLSAYQSALSEVLGSVRWAFLIKKVLLQNKRDVQEGEFEFVFAFDAPSDIDYIFGVYGDVGATEFGSDRSLPLLPENPVTYSIIRQNFQHRDGQIYTNASPAFLVYSSKSIEKIGSVPSYFLSALDYCFRKHLSLRLTEGSNRAYFYRAEYLRLLEESKPKNRREKRKKLAEIGLNYTKGPAGRRY